MATSPIPAAADFLQPDADRAFAHLRVLATEIGSRTATTQAEREAAAYIAAQLTAAGYEVTVERFDVEIEVDRSTVELPGTAEPLRVLAMSGSPEGEASGRVVAGGLGRSADLAEVDARGAVLLLDRGSITFVEKARNAEAAGAVAVMVVNNRAGPFRGALGDEGAAIPVVSVAREDADALDALAGGEAAVTVVVRRERVEGESQNVVARLPGTRCEGYLGAHYDSVDAGPGANDNASGTAALIELARTHRVAGLCAVAFGSEEVGLLGSIAFTQARDVRSARFMVNLDMVAKVTDARFVATDGDSASRDLAELAAGLAATLGHDVPVGGFPPFASSDHATFSALGVAAITIHSGDDDAIHTAGDDLDNVSREDLAIMLEVAAALLRALLAE